MIETILVTRQPSYGWVQHSGPSSGMFFHFPLEALSFFLFKLSNSDLQSLNVNVFDAMETFYMKRNRISYSCLLVSDSSSNNLLALGAAPSTLPRIAPFDAKI